MKNSNSSWQRNGFSQSFIMIPTEAVYMGLTKRQLLVLLVLCSHSDKLGNVIISREKISLKTGIHISDISKTYSELEEIGFIEHRQQIGLNACNTIRLKVPRTNTIEKLVEEKHGKGKGHGKGDYLPQGVDAKLLQPYQVAREVRKVMNIELSDFEDPFDEY
ncbi:helix-turn-helix domain-containing protein [Methylobacillus methanolivorans]|uniref:Helix-turn-helix domain-containing protein n=1 Tax=Methylobacillus methanolivorans TaxID=1848927 RepID=A0ABW8GPT3_9PROT